MKRNRVLMITIIVLFSITCCAAWSACSNNNEYLPITYELNGGINSAANPAVYTSDADTITLQAPTKTGYTFVGWVEGNTIPTGSMGNKTFTAEWSIITYDIEYTLNGGTNHTANPIGYTVESATITLQAPTKAGYTFAGWTEGNTIATGSTGNKTFTAEWTKDTYTITYALSAGANHADNPNGYDVESATITLQAPTKTGYTFAGWVEGSTIVTGSTGNKTFTAEWTKDTYTITYALSGGANHVDNPIGYTVESATITLQAPTKTGYTFAGWVEGSTIVTGSTGNKTFTAEWTKDTYAITYVLNGGANHADNPVGYNVESATITLQAPTKTGYTFAGWTEGNTIATGSTGNKTFTAEWTKDTYAITYVLNGGANHVDNPIGYNVDSASITLQAPTKTGYTFAGWTEGNTIATGSTGNKTFTAEWTKDTYTIIYTLNGGTNHADNPIGYTVESATITLQAPTKTGYTFAGWAEGGTIATGSTGNKTFTAEWSIITYDIEYTLNGGTQNAANVSEYTVESADITLQAPTYTGYAFGGWFANDEFSGTSITTITTGTTGNKHFYAKWNDIFTYSGTTITGLTEVGNTIGEMTTPAGFTAIADNAFKDKTNITSFVVPASITSVGANAFSGCTNLSGVTLNEGLETIGNNAFVKCTFTTFTVPSTVTSVGDSILGGCAKLTELTIPYTGASASVSGTAQNFGRIFGSTAYSAPEFVLCQSLQSNGNNVNYYIPAGLKTVTFNTNITTIKANVFRNCTTLEVINMPSTVNTMDNGAFYGCTSLKSFTLPTDLTTIGDTTFQNCTALTTLTTPAGLKEIKPNAFSGCTNLSDVTLNEGLETIGNNAFVKCSFTTFTVPNTVTSVGDSVLGGCAKLTEVTIPYTGNSPGATATGGAQNFGHIFGGTVYSAPEFVLCQSLKANGYSANYYIPAGLKTVFFNTNITTIKSNVFLNCTTLETINLPSSVTTISDSAFNGCTALLGITIPSGVATIANNAFVGCTNLLSVTLQRVTVVTNLEAAGIFASGRTIYVPSSMLNSYKTSYPYHTSQFAVITE